MKHGTYLKHYGILGMHWGVRKDGGVTKLDGSQDYKTAKEFSKKKKHQLSNQELKALLERQSLESRYDQLNPKKVAIGQRILLEILKEIGRETIKSAVKETIKFTFIDNRK